MVEIRSKAESSSRIDSVGLATQIGLGKIGIFSPGSFGGLFQNQVPKIRNHGQLRLTASVAVHAKDVPPIGKIEPIASEHLQPKVTPMSSEIDDVLSYQLQPSREQIQCDKRLLSKEKVRNRRFRKSLDRRENHKKRWSA